MTLLIISVDAGFEIPARKRMRVAVVLLGDIGRSPRMMYHACSLSRLEATSVTIFGYDKTKPIKELREAGNVSVFPVKEFPKRFETIPIVNLALKMIFLF